MRNTMGLYSLLVAIGYATLSGHVHGGMVWRKVRCLLPVYILKDWKRRGFCDGHVWTRDDALDTYTCYDSLRLACCIPV